MTWKDAYGNVLREGDIVEDTEKRLIGKITMRNGEPVMIVYKRFDLSLLTYETVMDYKGPIEGHTSMLVPYHSKVWWWRHGRYLDNVELLKRAEKKEHVPYGTVKLDNLIL